MLQVLLVDDEPFITQGLSVLIDWEAQGFAIAGSAANAEEALAFLRRRPVDLIICDIRMPGMSGLELAKKLRKEGLSRAYFAILSGYSDFNYAREALCCECIDYILKPVVEEKLFELLGRVKNCCRDREEKQHKEEVYGKAYLAQNLLALIHGKYDAENLDYVKANLQLSGGIRYVDIELNFAEDGAPLPPEQRRDLQRRLFENCRLTLGKKWAGHCLLDVLRERDNYNIGLIFCYAMAQESGKNEEAWLGNFLDRVREGIPVQAVMFVGNRVENIVDLAESCRTAMVARSFQNFHMERADVLFYQARSEGDRPQLKAETLERLVKAIEENDKPAIETAVDTLYAEINAAGMDAELIQIDINYLLFRLVHLACAQDDTVNQEEILRYIRKNTFDTGDMGGSRAHLAAFAVEYSDYLLSLRQNQDHGVLSEVEREVRLHYNENLTLKSLSQKYFVNSAYLGQMFFRKYGQTFKEYLNTQRIEQSVELLCATDEKVYCIAEMVGYRSAEYFIDKFIAAKGCTPSTYRKQQRDKK